MGRERNRWRVVVNRLPADCAIRPPPRMGPPPRLRDRAPPEITAGVGPHGQGAPPPPHGPQRDLENQGPAAPEREVPSTPTGGAGRSGRSPAPGVGVVWGGGSSSR